LLDSKNKKGLPRGDKPFEINIDKSSYSPATHIVLDMMMVVVDSIECFSHLRQLRNQIVFGSQNFRLN